MSTVVSSPVSETVSDSTTLRDRVLGDKRLLVGLASGFGAIALTAGLYSVLNSPESPKNTTSAQTSIETNQSGPASVSESTWPGRSILQQPEQSIQPLDESAPQLETEYESYSGADAPRENIPSVQYYREHRIDELLNSGDRALAEYRLTTPEDDSAAYYYRKALELAPQNSEAKAGLQRVVAAYIELAEQKWIQGDAHTARTYLERATSVDPGNPEILAASRRMAASKPVSPAPRRPLDPASRYPNIRAAKTGYRNHEISKTEYARIRDVLTIRYRKQIDELKRLYREGKLSKAEYKRLTRKAETEYKG